MSSVSPELVLVDPTLREVALASLPAPGDCLARQRPEPAVVGKGRPACLLAEPLGEIAGPGNRSALSQPALETVFTERERGRAAEALPILAALTAFLFAYFLGSPLLELLEAGRAALPI
jgi:hypothetical protein